MATVAIDCLLKNHIDRNKTVVIPGLAVDTSVEATWIPRSLLEQIGVKPEKRQIFQAALGQSVYRDIGYVILRVGQRETADEVVFADQGDRVLLGVRALKGLSLWVDPMSQKLIEIESAPLPSATDTSIKDKIISPGTIPGHNPLPSGSMDVERDIFGASAHLVGDNPAVLEAIYAREKITAIKLLRDTMPHLGLAEAKELIERQTAELEARFPQKFVSKPQPKGCTAVLMMVVIIALFAFVMIRFAERI